MNILEIINMTEQKRGRGRPPKSDAERRVVHSLRLNPEDKEQFRRAAYWLRKDVNDIIEQVALKELHRLQKENGGPFDPIPEED